MLSCLQKRTFVLFLASEFQSGPKMLFAEIAYQTRFVLKVAGYDFSLFGAL